MKADHGGNVKVGFPFSVNLDTLEERPQALGMIIVLAIFLVILAYLAVDHLFDL